MHVWLKSFDQIGRRDYVVQIHQGIHVFSSPQAQDSQGNIPVALTITSGEIIKGYLTTSVSGKLDDTMNRAEPYIELKRVDGTVALINKTVIAQIEQINIPRTDQLSKRALTDGVMDPHAALGVSKTSSILDIQSAYHALARRYHPDHFSGREIPPEVLQYVSAMFQRITMAYNELKSSIEKTNAA